ncbi:MAG: S49 family peptidase, partial [Candidatus Rokuibacteriota bacterium]
GMAFGWSGGDDDLLGRKSFLSFGALSRPSRALTYGLVYRTALGETDRRFLVDLGLRPLGSSFVTLFGDYAVRTGQVWTEGDLEAGISLRPLAGVDATFKLQPEGAYQVGLGVTVGRFGFTALPRYDTDGNHQETHFLARANPSAPGFDLDSKLSEGRRMLEVDLHGRLAYQKYRWGDSGTLPLLEVIEELEFARRDPTVSGVVLSLSGLSGNPEMIWEIRVKLEQLRASGKSVVAYVDRVGLSELYLASVADRIVVHPEGSALLPGIPAYRTYLKNMLAKIGVGFEEWRHFKYKSANESLSRDRMSDADREQRLELIQAFYDEMATGIAASRRISRAAVDSVVNHTPLLFPEQLVEA